MLKITRAHAVLFLILFPGLSQSHALFWADYTLGAASDSNLFKYPTKYSDMSYFLDLKLNQRSKLSSRTRSYALFNFSGKKYDKYRVRDYMQNVVRLDLEQDFVGTSVLSFTGTGEYFIYGDSTSAKYNYLNLTVGPQIRLNLFYWNDTAIDIGAKYEELRYPNYSFAKEGFTATIAFREELAQYQGFRHSLSIQQTLPYSGELQLSYQGAIKDCPERFLYASQGYPYVHTSTNRQDHEFQLSINLSKTLVKNSKVAVGFSHQETDSNANTPVFNPDVAVTSSTLVGNYYGNRADTYKVGGTYFFGKENSYLRVDFSYADFTYPQRPAVDRYGRFFGPSRKDSRQVLFAELSQVLGNFLSMNWALRLSYTNENNNSTDYFYNYRNEVYSLGLNGNFVLR